MMFKDTSNNITSEYAQREKSDVIVVDHPEYLSNSDGDRSRMDTSDTFLWNVVQHPVDLDPIMSAEGVLASDDSEMQNWITSTSEASSVSPSSYFAVMNGTDMFESHLFGHFNPYDQESLEMPEHRATLTGNNVDFLEVTFDEAHEFIKSEEQQRLHLLTPPPSESSEQRGHSPLPVETHSEAEHRRRGKQVGDDVKVEKEEEGEVATVEEYEEEEKSEMVLPKKGKRTVVLYPNELLERVRKYTNTVQKANRNKAKILGRDVKLLQESAAAGKVAIGSFKYTIVPESEWKSNYMLYLIPNGYVSSVFLVSFVKSMVDDVWVYYDNINEQPHFNLNNAKLPFRYCDQIANYYEPFIIREKRKDGRRLTKEEKRVRSDRRRKGKSKDDSFFQIEALCPYCPIKFDNVNKFDDYFYGRNDSDYLHHVTKHHGVYSDGSEHALPDLVVLDDRGRFYAHCEECEELVKIKDPTGEEIVGNRFLGYLRHCLKHRNRCKNGGGESRLKRRERVVENAARRSLLYEDGEKGELLVHSRTGAAT